MPDKKAPDKVAATRNRSFGSAPAVHATGIAIAGALIAMAITAPRAAADESADASSSLSSVIDQILTEEQVAVTQDSTLAFATSSNDTLLPGLLQNLELEQLMLALHADDPSELFAQIPDVTNGDASDVSQWGLLDNPDVFYDIAEDLDPDATYVITGTFSSGTEELSVNTDAISATGSTTVGSLELDDGLTVNADGTYTIEVAPTEPSDAVNYISDAGANYLLVRSTMGDWADGPSTVNIECIADCPAATSGVTDTGLSPAAIDSVLTTLAEGLTKTNDTAIALAEEGGITQPENTMSAFESASQSVIGAAAAQYNSAGEFDLEPGQALIVEIPNEDIAGYSGINLYTAWGQTLPYPLEIDSLNNTQAFEDPDGYTYYVVSATNPGVANWLDTGGLETGEVYARFLDLPAGTDLDGLTVTTEVVPVADVSEYLPADTPTVSPAEYAATMTNDVLSYDYAEDVDRTSNSSWVAEQLWIYDLQQTMGTANYDAVFGDPDASSTPMWLRLTPALSPDWTTVAKDFLTDPSGSLTAIENNVTLAENDIALPTQLAETLLQQDFSQTFQAVEADLTSDNWAQALTDLETGGQQLGSILDDALFDPNTSITAGILDARDDLATAVVNAKGGSPTDAGLLATLEWDVLPQLTQLSDATTATEFGSDLSALLSALGTDLSSLL